MTVLHNKYLIERELLVASGKRLIAEKLASRSWGNISLRLNDTQMLITPSGRSYEQLMPEEMVLVNLQTLKHDGTIRPSSEYLLHTQIYTQRPDCQAIIHTHQPYASTVSTLRCTVPAILDDMAQLIGASLRCTKYELSGSLSFAQQAANAIEGRNAALLANHGAVCIGRDMDEAFAVSEVLEKSCKVYLDAAPLGGAKAIEQKDAQQMHQFYIEKYSVREKTNRKPSEK